MGIIITDAQLNDVDEIYNLGIKTEAFRVSKTIPFYEKEELIEWIHNPIDNIMCIAYTYGNDINKGIISGFAFCKVMSYHWAMLDNLYVLPEERGKNIGSLLFGAIKIRLKLKGTRYLTTLIEEDNKDISKYLCHWGYTKAKNYTWYETLV